MRLASTIIIIIVIITILLIGLSGRNALPIKTCRVCRVVVHYHLVLHLDSWHLNLIWILSPLFFPSPSKTCCTCMIKIIVIYHIIIAIPLAITTIKVTPAIVRMAHVLIE